MRKLNVTNNSVCIALSWKSDGAKALILGIDEEFRFTEIGQTESSSYIIDKPTDFVGFKVLFTIDDKIIDSTKPVLLNNKITESTLAVVPIKSFRGYTLNIIGDHVYDFYRIYDMADDVEFVMDSDDFVINSINFIPDHVYYVEAYNYTDNGEKLMTSSLPMSMFDMQLDFSRRYGKMEKSPAIDVIIPVYNPGYRLLRCVDSILTSSFRKLHIILVDDGSTDKVTKEILMWYETTHKDEITVIRTENKGVSHARNVGLHAAKSEWVALMDNDDYVDFRMYEKLYTQAVANNTDIAIAQTVIREMPGEHLIYNNWDNMPETVIYNQSQMWNNRGNIANMYFVAVWNKIVKREVALKTDFPEVEEYGKFIMYEDDAYTPSLYSYIDNFLLVRGAYYCWDKRKQKTTGTASNLHERDDALDVWKAYMIANSWGIKHHDEKYANIINHVCLERLLNVFIKMEKCSDQRIPAMMIDFIRDIVNEYDLIKDEFMKDEKHINALARIMKNA